jgi:methionine synthase II (cobalamin-independent)
MQRRGEVEWLIGNHRYFHETRTEKSKTHTHVCRGTHKGIRNRVDQFSRNSKVADLDFTLRIEEDV